MNIVNGPSLYDVLLSLSVVLPVQASNKTSPTGYPVEFIVGHEGSEGLVSRILSVVITGVKNSEYNYSDLIVDGYFKKQVRFDFIHSDKLQSDAIGQDIDGWLTFVASYNVSTRKGRIIVEYSKKKPCQVDRLFGCFDFN